MIQINQEVCGFAVTGFFKTVKIYFTRLKKQRILYCMFGNIRV
jgi:hypothetical protein